MMTVHGSASFKIIIYSVFFSIIISPVVSLQAGVRIPTSSRAHEAINKTAPLLKKELKKAGFEYGAPIYIRIFKEEKVLELWVQQKTSYKLFRTYPVCTYGPRGLGPKLRQGDGKAPEGFYFVAPYALNPMSKYHLSFNLGYPNKYDRAHKRTGSALMVHGRCVSIGCYAMTDKGIEQIYTLLDAALKKGQPFFRVHIFPFKMTLENMKSHRHSKWYSFWKNLKTGYDFFQKNNHIPPDVDVRNLEYVFNIPADN